MKIWTGEAGDGDMRNPENWKPGVIIDVPDATGYAFPNEDDDDPS